MRRWDGATEAQPRRATDLRSVKRAVFTEVVILRGAGVPEDPCREVTMIFDDDGRCVAEHDPIFPTPWYAPDTTCHEARRDPPPR